MSPENDEVERGTFTVPNVTRSVSKLGITLFSGVQSTFWAACPTIRLPRYRLSIARQVEIWMTNMAELFHRQGVFNI
jgi:hypothetical protein